MPASLETITVLVSVMNPDAATITSSTVPATMVPRSAGADWLVPFTEITVFGIGALFCEFSTTMLTAISMNWKVKKSFACLDRLFLENKAFCFFKSMFF